MKPPSSVLLLSDDSDVRARTEVPRLREWFESRGVTVAEAGDRPADVLRAQGAELALVLGGDGTFLRAVHRLEGWDVPFLGVRFGSFGYLAELEPDHWEPELERLLEGEGRLESWMRLQCRVRRPDGAVQVESLALNEAVVTSGEVATMLDVDLCIDGERISRYRGDGLIVSTAVGSTAHSLAAGGPILEPTVRSFLLTPMTSQALTYRPLVLRSGRSVELALGPSRHGAAVSVDGRMLCRLEPGWVVETTASDQDVRVATVVQRSRFRTLRERLHWGTPVVETREDAS